jgi:ribosomal protein S18 acetylase RimI-like enzyme
MVATSLKIKRAGIKDAQLVSDLSIITFIETYRGKCSDKDMNAFMDEYFNEKVIYKELEDPDDFYYIIYTEGFPAGYMRLAEDYEGYPLAKRYKALHLKRIYVLKEFHSKKLGSALMSYALQFAAQNNYELLWLGVWEHNNQAKLFYEKWGFEDRDLPYTFNVGEARYTDYWLMKFIDLN